MPENLEKLRPDRDLQCYFSKPTAIAAMSNSSTTGFVVSGCWRQQFDWAVVEWNRDNVFEHPLLRNIPDGDLSSLILEYEETRSNCIALDSSLYPTVDWPYLRIWATADSSERLYRVSLAQHASPVDGSYVTARATFTLQGSPSPGDFVGLSWLGEHHTHQLYYNDTLESTVQAIADSVNAFSPAMTATVDSQTAITLHYTGPGGSLSNSTTGTNGNGVGVYSYVSGSGSEYWSDSYRLLQGGQSPVKWRVSLDFQSLRDINGDLVPTFKVRKMRWTYAAGLQRGPFERSEFDVSVSAWTITGTRREYKVPGTGSARIEDDSICAIYAGEWKKGLGNFSGGSIKYTGSPGSTVVLTFDCSTTCRLLLGTRWTSNAPIVNVTVDSQAPSALDLKIDGEDALARLDLGTIAAGTHRLAIEHAGGRGQEFFFDFVELVVAASALPECPVESELTLATDWDTDHSLALPPERTAWLVDKLGFRGRVNHYAGAMWFYELGSRGFSYASATIEFWGTPVVNSVVTLWIGQLGQASDQRSKVEHLVHPGDTAETLATAFQLVLNNGFTAVRAESTGSTLRLFARHVGVAGNSITIDVSPGASSLVCETSGPAFSGGTDGVWITDLTASPRLNRAARDWHRAFFVALGKLGIDATIAFSTELQHGDPSSAAGIAQVYPSGNAVIVGTPALQTNFSPASTSYWKLVYREAAALMAEAGLVPYVQFGEVQWWYFPDDGSGMPYYDSYTGLSFSARYGRPLPVFADGSTDPTVFHEEAAFLSGLVGAHTRAIMDFVLAAYPQCRFEVLYPTDVNSTPFNRTINYPTDTWTADVLQCLKTESFTYTLERDLDAAIRSMQDTCSVPFPRERRSHLVGIASESTAWSREARIAEQIVGGSVVLFALDQFCLIGYRVPVSQLQRRSVSFTP
jgi:hypothetical protein